MPSSPPAFVAHCLELLQPLGAPRARRMFSGHGLYLGDLFIAIVVADRLYLKVDADTLPRFEAAGSRPFVVEMRGKETSMSYRTAPDEALDSPAAMEPWARLAIAAALRSRAKPGRATRPSPKSKRAAGR